MFDIRDYYREHERGRGGENAALGDIASDISLDLDRLLANRFDSLYKRVKFKHHGHGVEIPYPRISYPENRSLLQKPDHLRNLLSLYPGKSDLEYAQKIVLRPRYVEVGDTELMALYLRRRRVLVLYLHHPHSYRLDNSKFSSYAELSAEGLGGQMGHRETSPGENPDAGITVPPLWYILSIISPGEDDTIDKFFIRKKNMDGREISSRLYETSFFYSRHGY